MGRMTLNPIVHIDLIWTIIIPLALYLMSGFMFGAAKPVPVNELNLKRWRRDGLLVAAAGPGSNLVLAVGFTIVVFIINRIPQGPTIATASFAVATPILTMAIIGIKINLLLALFNLVPIPPLDGGRVATHLFPQYAAQSAALERFGILIVFLLLYVGVLDVLVFQPTNFLFRLLLSLTV